MTLHKLLVAPSPDLSQRTMWRGGQSWYNCAMKTISPIVASVLALCAFQAPAAEAAKKHIVTFRRLDGTILKQVQVAHGGKAVAPAAPAVPDFKLVSVPKANGQPSGVHTNLALTATVRW